MSDLNNELPVSLLDQFKAQRAQFIGQRDFTQQNLNQLIGAIHACDVMIEKIEMEHQKQTNEGGQGNGGSDNETQE